ncbi:hypothetical protein [Streptomyces sp. 061-3]|uniref:hypothetical protein n=1 Tax=Streptomyces sp. 061-3 TaxID=2789268 RepID=UPI00398082E8
MQICWWYVAILADITILQDRRRPATVLRAGVPFDLNASALTNLSTSGEFAC